jgi:phytoene dehydrogenase-like protein
MMRGQKRMRIGVVGGGMSGLVAAAKLAKATRDDGIDAEITLFERQSQVGGLAQGYTRQIKTDDGRRFEVDFELPHLTAGFRPGELCHDIYRECDVDWEMIGEFIAAPKFAAFRAPDCPVLEILNTSHSTRDSMIIRFPEAAGGIDRIFQFFEKIEAEAGETLGPRKWYTGIEDSIARVLSRNRALQKIACHLTPKKNLVLNLNKTFRQTLDEYLPGDDEDTLNVRATLSLLYGFCGLPVDRVSSTMHIAMMNSYWRYKGGFAPGDCSYQRVHEELARAFERNGGRVITRAHVDKIHIDDRKIKGLSYTTSRAGKKTEHHHDLDVVVVSSDLKKTLLGQQNLPKDLEGRISALKMSTSFMSVHALFEMDLSGMDQLDYGENILGSSRRVLETPDKPVFPTDYFIYACVPTKWRKDADLVRSLDGSPTDNIHIIDLVMESPGDYEQWQRLRKDREAYDAQKRLCAKNMIRIAESQLIPGLRKNILNMKDVSSPTTYERFCATELGAVYGPEATPDQFIPNRMDPRTKVKGLYLTGAATHSAGLAGVVMAGVKTFQVIEKDLF